MVVNGVREMVGGDAVRLEQNEVLTVLRHFNLSFNQIREHNFPVALRVAVRQDAQYPRVPGGKVLADLLQREIPHGCLPLLRGGVVGGGPFPGLDFGFLVGRLQLLVLLLRGEAGVGFAFRDKLFCEHVIDMRPLALPVGTVTAAVRDVAVRVQRGALVEADAVLTEDADQLFRRAGDLSPGVGVLNAQEHHAARLMRQPLVNGGAVQPAQMHESGRAGGKPRDLGALRQIPRGVARFHIGGGVGHIGEQQVS